MAKDFAGRCILILARRVCSVEMACCWSAMQSVWHIHRVARLFGPRLSRESTSREESCSHTSRPACLLLSNFGREAALASPHVCQSVCGSRCRGKAGECESLAMRETPGHISTISSIPDLLRFARLLIHASY